MHLDTLDKQGRLVVPAHIRETLGLAVGTLLIVEEGEAGDAILHALPKPSEGSPPQHDGPEAPLIEKGGLLVAQATPQQDVDAFIAHERDQRLRDVF